jgi:hypothetical protein
MKTEDYYRWVYNILITVCGAPTDDTENFVRSHYRPDYAPTMSEWRFQGKLGFGGKYWSESNSVSCYKEDESVEILSIIEEVNQRLSKREPHPKNPDFLSVRPRDSVVRGEEILIPKGVSWHSTHPTKRSGVTARSTKLAVQTTTSKSEDRVTWAGSSGYWRWCDKTEIFKRAVEP